MVYRSFGAYLPDCNTFLYEKPRVQAFEAARGAESINDFRLVSLPIDVPVAKFLDIGIVWCRACANWEIGVAADTRNAGGNHLFYDASLYLRCGDDICLFHFSAI